MKSVIELIPQTAYGWLTINSVIASFNKNDILGSIFMVIGWLVLFAIIAALSEFISESISKHHGKWTGKTYHGTYTKPQL